MKRLFSRLLPAIPLLFSAVLMADDAEIYYSQGVSVNPNILFVLDTSLSMECQADSNGLYDKPDTTCVNKNTVPDSGGKTRMQVMQEAVSAVLTSAPSNLNIGLMRYGGHGENQANGVSFPVKPIDLDKDGNGSAKAIIEASIPLGQDNLPNPTGAKQPVRTFLQDVANSWQAGGNTPIVDALYEASRYYRGDAVDFGNLAPDQVRAAHPATYVNDTTLNCQTNQWSCNNTAKQCNAELPITDCKPQTHTVCKTYKTETVTSSLTNQCCGWETVKEASTCQDCKTVKQPGMCQDCKTVQQASTCQVCTVSGYDESGKPINSCKDVACMKDVQQCTDVACMKDVQQCTDVACTKDVQKCIGGFSCSTPTTNTQTVCAEEEVIEEEICQQQQTVCGGAKRYISPIEHECQANYVVLMSDGRPEYAGSASSGGGINQYPLRKNDVQTLTGKGENCGNDAPNGYKSGTCGPELTHFQANSDQASSIDGKQAIGTFTVAFGVEDKAGTDYLASLANMTDGALAANDSASLKLAFDQVIRKVNRIEGGQIAAASVAYQAQDYTVTKPLALAQQPRNVYQQVFGVLGAGVAMADVRSGLRELLNPLRYWGNLAAVGSGAFTASNLDDLTKSFNSILDKIDAASASFSAPAYSIDKSNLLAHGDNVYIPVFERSLLPLWSGNLKKFKVAKSPIDSDSDGVVDIQKGQIYSTKNNKPAVDDKGQFANDAWDEWSTSAAADGNQVQAGGAAALLNPASRTLYTDAGGAMGNLGVANTAITKTLLGDAGMDDALHASLLAFARGYDKDGTTPRHHMGDIMNSKPAVLDYIDGKSYVLVGTNEGFLHAFDTDAGAEKWAFMPQSLLKNIRHFYDNNQPKTHFYGVDGQLVPWLLDKNGDGKVDASKGEKAYLFFGLRRGGQAYYALDVTDISAPSVAWTLSSSQTDFAELGESWSKPALAKMRVQEAVADPVELKDVLVFGGGFDPALEEENPASRVADAMGRDVFIVDALSGNKLWSLRADVLGADALLTHSIPGDIRVLDMDRNGALDRLYFADTGGKVWRVDMDMDLRDADASMYDYADARLTNLANLGGSGTDKRKFYYEPDIALMQHQGQTVMTLTIGSGYRSHPQSAAIQDRFYVLKDEHVYAPAPETFTALTDADLTEADALAATGKSILDAGYAGWYYDLPNNAEKVLAPAVSFLNKVLFTTFAVGDGTSDDPCNAPANIARAYVLDLFNGQAVADLDRDGTVDATKDKSVVAGVNEILGGAQIVFLDPVGGNGVDACTEGDCQQTVEIRVGKMLLPVMDKNNAVGAGVAGSVDLTDILPRTFWREDGLSY
ncbi:MAG: PilC/PilY family type IV pilus protein [Candidatus Thiothrix putei]|uniref:PilC/PilY family type IV pilus protein n=1 Tax=Candidatus Thiothrix putei TaxID=3080811 RepID=A0AA95KH44_9GAMM|nr:MAG: PilC/PilY family type IV pilus protein [Candidatus Thiothrix putei]